MGELVKLNLPENNIVSRYHTDRITDTPRSQPLVNEQLLDDTDKDEFFILCPHCRKANYHVKMNVSDNGMLLSTKTIPMHEGQELKVNPTTMCALCGNPLAICNGENKFNYMTNRGKV